MRKYNCVLFDLDGTLVNTFPGILHSYQHAAKMTGFPIPTEQIVGEVIGAPLAEVFRKQFVLGESEIKEALQWYRDYYAKKGLSEVLQYEGMEETLVELKRRGYSIGVTTLKKESFAKEMLEQFGLSKYFDVIIGMDDKDQLTKSEMVKKALGILEVSEDSAILVGDSSYDAIGAWEANVNFIAVTYGFGFKSVEDVNNYSFIGVVREPMEILSIL